MDFKTFLQTIRTKATSKRALGDLFEHTIRDFLKASPEHDFEDVWMWSEWPDLKKYNFSKQDLGIDLVAKEKESGKFWAIQCKCYAENVQITKADLDSFFNHSGKQPFKTRLIVTTTNHWHSHALQSIENQTTPCHILKLKDLEQAPFEWSILGKAKRRPKRKNLRDYQKEAINKTFEHFKSKDRGQLIMACGTGKTLTSLGIVEKCTSDNAKILFLAPSIALINQTLKEYAYQSKVPQRYLVVCSDKKVGKEETGQTISDLQRSPTTKSNEITKYLKKTHNNRIIVFCTYQSLKQIKEAQSKCSAPDFDLVICDEAHRTTGIKGDEITNGEMRGNYFTLINKSDYVKAKKRLYMTATPKIYSPKVKSKASRDNIEIHCMDDTKIYGEEIYRLDFSRAIEQELLSDYKVIILDIDEKFMSDQIGLQSILKDTRLNLKDASLLIGCYKALRDQGDAQNGKNLKRAVAFLNTIKSSQYSKKAFINVVEALDDHQNDDFTCETKHIDGNDHSIIKSKKLDWLKEDAGSNKNGQICRILMNAKCLTEGIDMPSLDAVMFLHPRKSQVDVVQAVGRAIRKLPGKNYGYIILPVVIPAGKKPEEALNDNKTYQVVWQVLNALRSHDSEFNAIINNLNLNVNKPDKIKLIHIGKAGQTNEQENLQDGQLQHVHSIQQYTVEQFEHKVYAKMVEKCGDRAYREKWIKDIKATFETVHTRINSLVSKSPKIKKEFQKYLSGLHQIINTDITEKNATSMLAEHLVTKEVFDKIFEDYKFSEHNPVSRTMQKILKSLDKYGFSNELKELEGFYSSFVTSRISKIDNSKSRQKVIKELYEDFIKEAFPKMAERLGVAYTPIEIVDFILHSCNDLLEQEFKKKFTNKDVHIIDPFVGTGTFINRLFQNEHVFIKDKDLKRKFESELHANEIMLLPYYISAINIEEAYHSRLPNEDYKPFPGITLTDTFNINEQKELNAKDNIINRFGDNLEHKPFYENRKRIGKQKRSLIQVIVGNPPYSANQKSENDGNRNTEHPHLDQRVREMYKSNAQKKKNDTYIKAIRWATDRLKERDGIIGFVHNASLLEVSSYDGVRKSLVKEFDAIYCLNLRGDARTKGEQRRKEKDNVFDQNTRTPVVITFLIKHHKNKNLNKPIRIYYYDIGDYLDKDEKLNRVKNFKSIKDINWKTITPDKHGDWLNQRDNSFDQFYLIGHKKHENGFFDLYSCGLVTARDDWTYNFNKEQVQKNMKMMIDFYNQELERLKDKSLTLQNIDNHINRDGSKIKWTRRVKKNFLKNKSLFFQEKNVKLSSYRPFMKKWIYFDEVLNEEQYQLPKIFAKEDQDNKLICISGVGAKSFSVLITDMIPNYDFINTTQCFPFYYFDTGGSYQESITNQTLNIFREHYKDKNITKWDIFYYIYGLLHSESYREKYKNNLSKQLPRIPFVSDFFNFSNTGKKLAGLHLSYENQTIFKGIKIFKNGTITELEYLKKEDLKVTKMKINKNDLTKIQFNDLITIEGIPQEAWDYKINDWSAIKWIVERYQVKTDTASGIVNDPNTYSDNPAYILKLLLSIITVSIKTQALVKEVSYTDEEGSMKKAG